MQIRLGWPVQDQVHVFGIEFLVGKITVLGIGIIFSQNACQRQINRSLLAIFILYAECNVGNESRVCD